MFKKTLVAAAIGALSISAAYAADVTVYGLNFHAEITLTPAAPSSAA